MKKLLSIVAVTCLLLVACTKEKISLSTPVTGDVTRISCRNAVIFSKAELPGTISEDLSFGVLYSTSPDLLAGTATRVEAKFCDSNHNYCVTTEVLEPSTTYYYCGYISQSGEFAYGGTKSFKTLAVSSMIQTEDVTDVNPADAVLNAKLNLTDCIFSNMEYGFDVFPEAGTVYRIKASNHSQNKFSVKDETFSEKTTYSVVAYVSLDGRKYNGGTKILTTSSFVSHAVDLGLSVKWASVNVGATRPEEFGRHFAWADLVGQVWEGSNWSGGGFSTFHKYELDANNNLKPEYDAAHVLLGGKWRMPTHAEQQELIENCTSTWTKNYKDTGVAGMIFTSKKSGYIDKYIFLPAAGYGRSRFMYSDYSGGDYWSSTFYADEDALSLSFRSYYLKADGYCYRDSGFSVRPVSD